MKMKAQGVRTTQPRTPALRRDEPKLSGIGRAGTRVLAVVGIAVLVTSCAGPRAAEPPRPVVKLKWRETFRATENHSLLIGGLAGRAIGVMEQRGLAFFERDEVATLALWSTYETTDTNTTFRGYAQYTFKDAATIVALLEGSGAVQGAQNGMLTFLRGTGRFMGIEGNATFAAVAVTANDSGGDTYVDATGEYFILQTIAPPRNSSPTP